jgi:trehalose/maltose hydrolase-like predicted phosphorylase
VNGWLLAYEGFDPEREGLREALCTLGNGRFATRGAAPEARADGVHYPGTYGAGIYNRLESSVAGRVIENEDLVNLPNWLPLTFRVDGGAWFELARVELLGYRQELDLRTGTLVRRLRFRDDGNRETTLSQRRSLPMSDPHVAALETTLVAENWSGNLRVRSALDGTVVNAGVPRYRELANRHLRPVEQGVVDGESVYLVAETTQSRIRIGEAARTRAFVDGRPVTPRRRTVEEAGWIGHELDLDVARGQTTTIEKIVTLFTSRDHAVSEPGLEAATWVVRAGSFDELHERQVLAWEQLWRRFDIAIEGSDRAQLAVRLHVFHLVQTVSANTIDLDVGVPARGLHGEAYRGHIFWDELFIFPLLNYRLPTLTRSLLEYRHRRLPEARWAAREQGHRGAMFPWQSGSDGREENPRLHLNPRSGRWLPDNTHLQRHVNLAIAHNVWQYYEITGDIAFLRYHGAEILVEIARFLSSLAAYDPARKRYEIRGVVGPDEYHVAYPGREDPGIDNNAYTNVMTAWLMCRAIELFDVLPEHLRPELREELALSQDELDLWEDVSRRMFVPFHDGVISQFEGYEDLEEFDWDGYRRRYGDIQRLDRILEAEGDTADRYKASKQADVLMLFYLLSQRELKEVLDRLGYPFDPDRDIARNVDYYLERTSHGSTLSGVVHAWVLARLDRARSWEHLLRALESDVADVQGGTTPEGIHLGAMAGTVDLLQRGYAGLVARNGCLWFDPVLPDEVSCLEMQLHYREHRVKVELTPDRLRLENRGGTPVPIRVGCRGDVIELKAEMAHEWPLGSASA